MKYFEYRAKEYKLWRLIVQTEHAMYKTRMKELYRHKISAQHAAITYRIQILGEKATPIELARWLLQEPQSVSEIINKMKNEGLVLKERNENRKNQINVILTDKGQEVLRKASRRGSIHEILSVLSDEERKVLKSLLVKLRNKAIEKLGLEPSEIRI